MHSKEPSLFTRSDTILGACEGIGEDFGFNPQLLRVALAALLFWSPAVALGTYAAIALAVLLSRWLYPNPAAPSQPVVLGVAPLTPDPARLESENDDQPGCLAAAA